VGSLKESVPRGSISQTWRSVEFKRMAANYVGRWDLVQLRCSNFMSCTLAERLALVLLELSASRFSVVLQVT
jgi:hypothetical protein